MSSSSSEPTPQPPIAHATPHYGRYVGVLALVIIALITLNTALTKPNGGSGIAPGVKLPPFAAPLATGTLGGDVDVATHANDGSAGKRAACTLRGSQILNICQLYEQGPVVLTLFVDDGSCPRVLDELQALVSSYPQVRFAAVALKGGREEVRRLVRKHQLSFPVALDRDGILAPLLKVSTCPQVSFVYPGGVVQSRALLKRPTPATLQARVAALLAASRARGFGRTP